MFNDLSDNIRDARKKDLAEFELDRYYNNVKFNDLNSKERAAFFENMSLMLAGLNNIFGIYHDNEKFNKKLIDKADIFLLHDKEIITDQAEIQKTLKKPRSSRIVLAKSRNIEEPSIYNKWIFNNKLRDVMFGLALGSKYCPSEGSNLVTIKIGNNSWPVSQRGCLDVDDEISIDEKDINTYIKAIIPSSHKMVQDSLRLASIDRLYQGNDNISVHSNIAFICLKIKY